MNYNRVILGGRLTRDVELRNTPNGDPVANIGLAINKKWKDSKTGQDREEVTFVDCEAWGRTAETIAKFFGKGSQILIEGDLKLETWKDKTDGSNRSKLKVRVGTFSFVDGKGESDGKPKATGVVDFSKLAVGGKGRRPDPGAYVPPVDEDIPF